MDNHIKNQCTIFVLFGACGDLSARLIVPALFNLYQDEKLPENLLLLAVDREDIEIPDLVDRFRHSVVERSDSPDDGARWQHFASMFAYLQADVTQIESFHRIAERLSEQEKTWDAAAQRIFYMATPPGLFSPIALGLGAAGLAASQDQARIVVEKPLGRDLKSFQEINEALTTHFDETQIFRIDHFLGKETVQNILALRFANSIFEPIWNRRYIDHVAITVAETLGVEHRGPYYERAGALRDMVQNHLLQLLCLVAMEPPVAYDADDIRSKKLDVLRAIRPIPSDRVHEFAARGQYGTGWISGSKATEYRHEADVDPHSNTETFAALKLLIDNWRWQDVPFYLRTGKRMAAAVSEISIRFQDVPHHSFPASVGLNSQPARLVIQIQPEEGIVLKFMAKEPGSTLRLRLVDMRFSYQQTFNARTPGAYETLLWDVMSGDPTLFMRSDQVEAAWKLIMPILDVWSDNPAPDFPNYSAGSWGPASAEVLAARDGKSWLTPTLRPDTDEH